MGVPSQPLPNIGQPNSTEDAKVRSALSELQTILTGNVDIGNLAAKAVTSPKWFPAASVSYSTAGVNCNSPASFNTDVLTSTFTTTTSTRQLIAAMAVVNLGVDGNGNTAECVISMVMDGGALPGAAPYARLYGSNTSSAQLWSGNTYQTIAGLWLPTIAAGTHTLKLNLSGNANALISGSANVVVAAGDATLARLEMAA